MRIKKYRTFVCDFETTVYEGQEYTEAWAAACVEIDTEDVEIFGSLPDLFAYFKSIPENVMCYFHNLKFDGSFWLDYLLRNEKYRQAYERIPGSEDAYDIRWLKDKDMPTNTFKYTISDRGQWYSIIIRTSTNYIEIRDSLKLLPMSVERIGKAFSKYQKLDIEYKGLRYANCPITDEEKSYIKNDVLIPKEALEYMKKTGHTKMTIGSCCLSEFKQIVGKDVYDGMFPDLTKEPCPYPDIDILDTERTDYDSADQYIRRAYRGGWVYVVPDKQQKRLGHGITADVNSLYPSVMHSSSGNEYPIGLPTWWMGNYIPDEATQSHVYFYVRIRTRFYLKPGRLPFIQIKGSFLYPGTESLRTSDVDGSATVDWFGKQIPARVTLTLTKTDFYLMKEQYDLVDFEILDGCYFSALPGIFDEYINKYAEIKQKSKGALREIAKLFLNNLYGKLAANDNSSFKVAYLDDQGFVHFAPVEAHDKHPGHIASGAAVTSYARNFTITAAQKNYHGPGTRGFCYADTDSIHCDINESELLGCRIHETDFNAWKIEQTWDEAFFTRQKTYIERTGGNYNIKCAGMTKNCKELLIKSFKGEYKPKDNDSIELKKLVYSKAGRNFLLKCRSIDEFVPGIRVPGKLAPKRIKGGIVLYEQIYEMH